MTYREPKSQETRASSTKSVLLQLFFSLIVLGCGVALAVHYLKTAPKVTPRKRAPSPLMVQVEPAHYSSNQVIINAMGEVVPARELSLTSQVSGEVVTISQNFVPGGYIDKGEEILSIESIDYKLAVLQQRSNVAKAKSDLALEMGNQMIARQEFEILGIKTSEDEKHLMLRQPQLDFKKATLRGAEARLAQAELDLLRTHIVAPFNIVVITRSANLGSQISSATPFVRLAGTDEFWLKLSVPVSQLKWLDIPADNSAVGSVVKVLVPKIHGSSGSRTGRVIRLAPGLEKQGRMAVLYVAIKDPLARLDENMASSKILLGSYLQAEIQGKQLKSAIAIKRSSVHNSDTVWLFAKDNTLSSRKLDIIYKDREYVYVTSGLAEGEKIITSPISAPIMGTALKIWSATDKTDAQEARP